MIGIALPGLLLANVGSGASTPVFSQTPYLAGALLDVGAGIRDAYIVDVADSTGMGRGAGTGPVATAGARSLSIFAKMAEALLSHGLPVSFDAFFGWAGVSSAPLGTEYSAYFTTASPLTGAVTVGSDWDQGGNTLGGGIFRKASTNASPITFTPKLSCRYFDLYIPVNTTSGGISVSVDGGSATIINNASFPTSTFQVVTIDAGSEGAHTLSIESVNSDVTYLAGVVARSGTEKRIIVVNAGWRASKSGDWNVSSLAWSPLSALVALHPSAICYSLGINDVNQDVALATYQANTTAIIGSVSSFADIFIRVPNDIDPTSDNGPVYMADIDNWLRAQAETNDWNIIDTPVVIGDYATLNAAGQMSDGLHPKAAPYATLGAALGELVYLAATSSNPVGQTLSGAPAIGLTNLPYSFQPLVSGGAGIRTWSIDGSGDVLPTGLSISSSTGLVSGTPTAAQIKPNVVIKAVDSTGTATNGFSFHILVGAYASFTAVTGTSLAAYTADTGESWAISPNGTWLISSTGTAYVSAFSAQVNVQARINLSVSGDMFANADLIFKTTGTQQQLGVGLNLSGTTGYWFGYRLSPTKWEINKINADDSWTTLVQSAATYTPSAGASRALRFERIGNTLNGYVDGVLVCTATDSSYSGGSVGLAARVVTVSTDTSGPHLDNFKGGAL